jgi:small redox-active disulfide protein 2
MNRVASTWRAVSRNDNERNEGETMRIQILGTGCAKCKALQANAEAAVQALGLDAEVEKVEDIQEIVRFGVMMTPALAVDGKVKVVGKVASTDEIKKLLA